MAYLQLHGLGLKYKDLYSTYIQRWQARSEIKVVLKSKNLALDMVDEIIGDFIPNSNLRKFDEVQVQLLGLSVKAIQDLYDTVFLTDLVTQAMLEDLEEAAEEGSYTKEERLQFKKLLGILRSDLHVERQLLFGAANAIRGRAAVKGFIRRHFITSGVVAAFNLRRWEAQVFRFQKRITGERKKPKAKRLLGYFEAVLTRRRKLLRLLIMHWTQIIGMVGLLKNSIKKGIEEFKLAPESTDSLNEYDRLLKETMKAVRNVHTMTKQLAGEGKAVQKEFAKV